MHEALLVKVKVVHIIEVLLISTSGYHTLNSSKNKLVFDSTKNFWCTSSWKSKILPIFTKCWCITLYRIMHCQTGKNTISVLVFVFIIITQECVLGLPSSKITRNEAVVHKQDQHRNSQDLSTLSSSRTNISSINIESNTHVSTWDFQSSMKKFISDLLYGSTSEEDDESFFEKPFEALTTVPLHRHLTPIDLSKPFVFDDAEEIATLGIVLDELNLEDMGNMDSIIKELDEYHKNNTDEKIRVSEFLVHKPPPTTTTIISASSTVATSTSASVFGPLANIKATVDNFSGGIDKKLTNLGGSIHVPIQNTPIEALNFIPVSRRSVVTTVPPLIDRKPSNSSIIFPVVDQGKRSEYKTLPRCDQHHVLFESKCQMLLQQGSCPKGEQLIEDDHTGRVRCHNYGCNYPTTVPHNGECVLLKYFVGCPDGMHLILTRSGKGECDCVPRFIFSKIDRKCYEAFTQGPCHQSEYFVLGSPTTSELQRFDPRNALSLGLGTSRTTTVPPLRNSLLIPQCAKNPCRRNRFVCNVTPCPKVPKTGECVELNSPCEDGKGVIMINEDTLKPECNIQEIEPHQSVTHHTTEERILGTIPNLTCSPGTKRDINGQCKRTSKYVLS